MRGEHEANGGIINLMLASGSLDQDISKISKKAGRNKNLLKKNVSQEHLQNRSTVNTSQTKRAKALEKLMISYA